MLKSQKKVIEIQKHKAVCQNRKRKPSAQKKERACRNQNTKPAPDVALEMLREETVSQMKKRKQ